MLFCQRLKLRENHEKAMNHSERHSHYMSSLPISSDTIISHLGTKAMNIQNICVCLLGECGAK